MINITNIIKIKLIIYIKNIDENKVKEDIEIKKTREMNIAEIINTKKNYDNRNIIFIIK